MAGTVTSTAPLLLLFIFTQRWIIEGLTMGSLNE